GAGCVLEPEALVRVRVLGRLGQRVLVALALVGPVARLLVGPLRARTVVLGRERRRRLRLVDLDLRREAVDLELVHFVEAVVERIAILVFLGVLVVVEHVQTVVILALLEGDLAALAVRDSFAVLVRRAAVTRRNARGGLRRRLAGAEDVGRREQLRRRRG